MKIQRRDVLARLRVTLLLVFMAALATGVAPPAGTDAPACPKCGAPLEPGAAFCVRCGARVEQPAAAPPLAAGRGAVVQVITAHDKELTTTFGSLVFESNMRVDSILGSAFAIAPGTFVTESGLLVGAREVMLRSASGRSVAARVVGADPMIGVAILEADLPEAVPVTLRDTGPARAGESLDAVGFPSSTQSTGGPITSTGVVSGLNRRSFGIHPIEDYLQTDASLPRGLVGGPMLDSRGRVVGMSTGLVFGDRVLSGPESGIGYAIPAEWIARSIAWIRSGAPPRAWIGAYAVPADFESRVLYRLPPVVQLVIEQIFPGTPAAGAGLRRGDGLLKVQGEECASLSGVQNRLLAMKPEDPLVVELVRAGEPRSVSLTLVPRPDRPRLTGIDALKFFAAVDIAPRDAKSLVVTSVAAGSEAAHLKIAPGDDLVSVLSKKDWLHGAKDNSRWRSVRTVADLEERLATAYSDLDFSLGLRFRAKDGTKRELFVWTVLTPTSAL